MTGPASASDAGAAGPWLSVVGIGEDGLDGLGARARAAVDAAEVLVGGSRHLAMVPEDGRRRVPWPSPFDALTAELRGLAPARVCVLATGDPMHFGVGVRLAGAFAPAELEVIPAPSAFSLARARLGWAGEAVRELSVHGRAVESVYRWLEPAARLLVLGHDGGTPALLAAGLSDRGYGASRLRVLEHLGGDRERALEADAATWSERVVCPLHVVALELRADAPGTALGRTPGLPDEVFESDGQLTKRIVRAATVAALAPRGGQRLWDVGAGSASVAIEWLRAVPGAAAIALERDATRCARARRNALRLGTPELEVVEGEAPGALTALPRPDAVFVGGAVAAPGVLDAAWKALPVGGRLVANAVTIEGTAALVERHRLLGGDLVRIETARAERLGARVHGFRPAMAVTQLSATKQ